MGLLVLLQDIFVILHLSMWPQASSVPMANGIWIYKVAQIAKAALIRRTVASLVPAHRVPLTPKVRLAPTTVPTLVLIAAVIMP